jgi:uncharacterized protein YbjT (DUF2867 family)
MKEYSMSKPTTLVLGSTGKTGKRIVPKLRALGHTVREGSRRSNPPFDWDDASGWARALEGVSHLYVAYAPDLAIPAAPLAIERLTGLARAAGVKKLVLLSGRGEHNAVRCEDIVRASGVPYAIVRASWFSQNFSEGQLLEPVRAGVVALPAREVYEPFIDVEDIADVAVAALDDERHTGRLYEVTGPRLLRFADAVAEISKAAGREVVYVPMASADFHAAISAQAGPALADMLTNLCDEVFDGRNAQVANGVQEALGRPARDFADFCREMAASGVWRV